MALIDQDATIRALVQLHEETGVKTAQAIRVVREMPEADVQEGVKGAKMTFSELVQKGYDTFLKNHQDLEYVVRCKDCNFYTADERWCIRLGLCGAFDSDGFCSHGERKETEDAAH